MDNTKEPERADREKKAKRAKKLGKRAARIAAGTAAAASLAVGSLFNSADEILHAENDEADTDAAAVVSVGKTPAAAQSGARKEAAPVDRFRAWLLSAPAAVRAVVVLPVWAVGRAGIAALSALWAALSPVWQAVLGVLLNALLLVLLFAAVYKLLFPNRPLSDLFKKKRWIPLALSAVALAVADRLLAVYVEGYAGIALIVKLVLGFAVLTLCMYRISGKRRRAGAAARPA